MCFKGFKHTPESLAKMRMAQVGKTQSSETREKKRVAMMGHPVTEETRAKISAIHKGKTVSSETRAKMSAAGMGRPSPTKGKPVSALTRAKMSAANRGENGPNWKGGVSFGSYCPKFNDEFKERVREFFSRVCVECGAIESGVKLCVHHVNFRKDACCAEDAVPLFVPLCRSCHAKTRFNKDYWESRFTTLIAESYGGRCYLPSDYLWRAEATALRELRA